MEHFCTLFDSGFLPQGLALHASLERRAGSYTLWVLCMDEAAEEALCRLALPHVRLIPLRDIETPALLAVKSGRSRAEYCWTLTPFLPRAVMDRDGSAQRVTYVDADCWFINDPRLILREMDDAGKDILITPHDYLPEYARSEVNGKFCVQFVPFKRTPAGLEVLSWWQERCLEWCFARAEDGRFGDQKYLDQWSGLFPKAVHVLVNTKLTLAPWNAARYCQNRDLARTGCMYHFHNFRIFQGGLVCFCLSWDYDLPGNILRLFYGPYLQDLSNGMRLALKAQVVMRFPSADSDWNRYIRFHDSFWRLIYRRGRIWRRISK